MSHAVPDRPSTVLCAFSLLMLGPLVIGCAPDRSIGPAPGRSLVTPVAASDQPKPNFNLEVILRDPADGAAFGHVKFRQDIDPELRVNLDTWVRDLAPNTHYKLQRATDANLDDDCTGTNWLSLGQGATAADLVTDDQGTGTADLWRLLATPGNAFDIRFRVIIAGTTTVVLASECYQFFVR